MNIILLTFLPLFLISDSNPLSMILANRIEQKSIGANLRVDSKSPPLLYIIFVVIKKSVACVNTRYITLSVILSKSIFLIVTIGWKKNCATIIDRLQKNRIILVLSS